MTTRGDSVILKNWNWGKRYSPKRGIDIAFHSIDKKNQEVCATLFGSEKDGIYKETINQELEKLSKNILSDRVRTINSLPKYKTIESKVERIQ